MSEFLAEAAVLIRPDTTKFRASLVAQLEAATKGIVVPVPVAAVASGRGAAAATKTVAAANTEAAVATERLNATRARQAVVDQSAAAAEARLAQAEQLTAAAHAKVIAVEAAGASTTTALAAARAQLRAADLAIVASERALDAAMVKGAEAAQLNAVETLRLAVAQRTQAKAAEIAAIATQGNASASAAAAVKSEQFRRGIEASGLSLGGIRGATLAASQSFLIGAAAVTVLAKSVAAASKEQEAAARATKIFGDNVRGLEEDASGLAQTFGLSVTQALEFEGAIGNILKVSGFAASDLPKLSEEIVKLGADMAAFNNVGIDQTLASIQLALVGNSRGLRRFGVELNQAAVNQEALRISGKATTAELTRQERVQARINILFRETTDQQGAAARRTGDLAQQTKVLKAEFENMAASLGSLVVPALLAVVHEANLVFKVFDDGRKILAKYGIAAKDAEGHTTRFAQALGIGLRVERDILFPLTGIADAVHIVKGAFDDGSKAAEQNASILSTLLDPALAHLGITWDSIINAQRNVVASLQQVQSELRHTFLTIERTQLTQANNQLDTYAERLVKVKIAGGDAAAQISVLNQAISKAQSAVDAATSVSNLLPKSKAAQKDRRAAENTLLTLIEQRKSLVDQQNQDAIAAADQIAQSVKDAAAAVKAILDAADQAFLTALSQREGEDQLTLIRAERTKSLVDDVAAQEIIRKTTLDLIAEAKKSISDTNLLNQTLLTLRTTLAQTNNTIAELHAEQAARAQERKQHAIDRKFESIDLDISLAATNKDIRGEIAARQRRIALDEIRLKAVRGDIIATKKLRNDVAEQNAAIAELRKELGKRNSEMAKMEFEFLQAQSGFAANLLSNLLPNSVIAGTVGGGRGGTTAAITTPTSRPPAGATGSAPSGGGGGGVIDFGPDASSGKDAATSTATGPRGASQVQMSALLHIQRQMLNVMLRLVGQRTHPEAAVAKAVQSVSMDFF